MISRHRRFCGALLSVLLAVPGPAWAATPHASTARTSRWWHLECGSADPEHAAKPPACTFTVKLRGAIDASRLKLVRRAIARRDAAQRALHRDIALRLDVDTRGGEVFAAMEIGRILRAERAAIDVRDGASCYSACVLLLIGAVERKIDAGARVAIHRPSLGTAGSPAKDALVEAMASSLALYAEQMNLPRKIIDDMMAIPSERLRFLGPSELAAYGIVPIDPIAAEQSSAAQGRGAASRP